jgi:type I restriction enzyme M protein
VGTEEVEDDGILFEDKMAGLKAQLVVQFEKGMNCRRGYWRILRRYNCY